MINLGKIMDAQGVSNAELARAINVDVRTIQRYRSGEIIPPLNRVVAIADYLDVSLDSLTGRVNPSPEVDPVGALI